VEAEERDAVAQRWVRARCSSDCFAHGNGVGTAAWAYLCFWPVAPLHPAALSRYAFLWLVRRRNA
jgi:hypothetical protein